MQLLKEGLKMGKEVFNRYERKYVIDYDTYEKLLRDLKPYINMDKYAKNDGYYTISNIYYDTVDKLFHHERMERQRFRQKLRLRAYNDVSLDDLVFLEIKKKYKGLVNKRRTKIKLKDVYDFLSTKEDISVTPEYEVSNQQILREMAFLKNFYDLVPTLVVAYERQAFFAIEDDDIRITFDKNVRRRKEDFRLENGSHGDLILNPELFILEVKLNGTLPLWLARILNEHMCVKRRFSKYSNSHNIIEELVDKEKYHMGI